MAEPVLCADDATFEVGGRALVQGVSLALHPGEVLGIIGPNGAGKSTLLRMLAGLLPPTIGSVTMHGRPMRAWPGPERARRLGYLPQHFVPHWDYTVAELLRLGLERAGVARDPHPLAEQHGLATLLGRRWSGLSGGERGRVLAASVLAAEPSILLADEATAALDVGQAAALMARLRGVAAGGVAVAVVAHDLNLALRGCDRIALLHEGRLRALDRTARLAASPLLDHAFGVVFRRVSGPDGPILIV